MLISLGLAEPPPAPEYKGNPETQVWIDLHTALYYCPGADLYGKTPKGKFDIAAGCAIGPVRARLPQDLRLTKSGDA